MGDVFDLDALERDTNGEPFVFRFDSVEYTLPARPDVRFAAAMQEGRYGDALRKLLGREQWATLDASDAPFDDEMFKKVIEAYAEHCGISLPE